MPHFRVNLETPIGPCSAAGDDSGLQELRFGAARVTTGAHPVADQLRQELEEYFRGQRRTFETRLIPRGTAFQQSVWRVLESIGYGQTRTYSELAEALGDRNKARAVGAANGANPILILIPCHRVIGKDGGLTGYAAGSDVKRALLGLESAQGGLF